MDDVSGRPSYQSGLRGPFGDAALVRYQESGIPTPVCGELLISPESAIRHTQGRIRTPETLLDSRGGIRPEFGALFGPKKSIGAGENLFALDRGMTRSARRVASVSGSSRRAPNNHSEQAFPIRSPPHEAWAAPSRRLRASACVPVRPDQVLRSQTSCGGAFNGIEWSAVLSCPIGGICTWGRPLVFRLRAEATHARIYTDNHPA